MLLWLDGFDWLGSTQIGWKYNSFRGAQYFVVNGAQPPTAQGGGFAFNVFNSFFDTYAITPPCRFSSNVVDVGGYIQPQAPSNIANPLQPWIFWRWESGPTNAAHGTNPFTQVVVGWDNNMFVNWIVGGQGDRFTAPFGTLVATTSPSGYQLPINTWVHIEMRITFGVSGRIQMWANDSLVFDQSGLNLQNPAHPQSPDRISLVWDNLAVQGGIFDDWFIADNQGANNNTQIGPARISTVFPIGDGISQGFTPTPTLANWQCVKDPGGPGSLPPLGPDGTATQVTAAGAGLLDLYSVARPACFGRILGIALNAAAQGGAAPSLLDLVCRPASRPSEQFDLADGLAVPQTYGQDLSTVQSISELFPIDGSVWRDGDIADALWGIRSEGALDVTQVFVEKLTSLRSSVTFDCGGGSYAYTR